jgi:hypothetical protein
MPKISRTRRDDKLYLTESEIELMFRGEERFNSKHPSTRSFDLNFGIFVRPELVLGPILENPAA